MHDKVDLGECWTASQMYVRHQSMAARKARSRQANSAGAMPLRRALVQNASQYDLEERKTAEMMKRCTVRQNIVTIGWRADLVDVV